MKVLVSSPFSLEFERGNAVTAKRIAGLLPEAQACHGWDGQPADLLIALHAHRSREAIERFQSAHPDGRVAVLLTGTDLNEFPSEELLEIGLTVDALIGMHEFVIKKLPERLRERARVIYPSVSLPALDVVPERGLVTLIGHLRPVKNPFLAVQSLGELPLRLVHIGKALSVEEQLEAERWNREEPRYDWLGGLPRGQTLEWLARSWLTLSTSRSEGASNVVAEAIVLGVPVLATHIEGNMGLLGRHYEGLFEPEQLEGFLDRALTDLSFATTLKEQQDKRRPLLSPEREAASWVRLLEDLFKIS
jgi:glycosyltransferase involved in cell wall biosynthesis